MRGLENEFYLYMLIASITIASFLVLVAYKWPLAAHWLFFLLFAWASVTNFYTSQQTPLVYLEYADLTWSEWYRDFINGWFAEHIALTVGTIAAFQGLIAISMLLRGWVFYIGAWGAILFLLAIVPLGVGSGFPSSLIGAFALYVLIRKTMQ